MNRRFIMFLMFFTMPFVAGYLATDFGSYIRWLAAFCFLGGAAFGMMVRRLREFDRNHLETPAIHFLSKGGAFIDDTVGNPGRSIMLTLLYGVCASLIWVVATPFLPQAVLDAFVQFIEQS